MIIKDEQLIFRCFECKKNYKKYFNKDLINRFSSTYEFCNEDINKLISLLRKGVYPYKHMDSSERFNETLLPDANRVFKNLSNNNLGDYHDLYVQSDTILLEYGFGNFRNMCIKVLNLILRVFYRFQD